MSINIHIIIPNGLSPLDGCLFAAEGLKRRALQKEIDDVVEQYSREW